MKHSGKLEVFSGSYFAQNLLIQGLFSMKSHRPLLELAFVNITEYDFTWNSLFCIILKKDGFVQRKSFQNRKPIHRKIQEKKDSFLSCSEFL
jgi:hypothetical protein